MINTKVTKGNLDVTIEKLCLGDIQAQNYNRECFGMSDLALASNTSKALDIFITRVFDSGYCAGALLDKVMKKYDYHMETFKPELKQQADDDFMIDISDFPYTVLGYCELAYIEKVKQHEEG